MSKERLDEIKEHYQLMRFNEENRALPSATGIYYEDLIYLINRVEELEGKKEFFRRKLVETKAVESSLRSLIEDYKTINKELHQRGRKIRKQNKRCREALEFYANEENYELDISYNPAQAIDCMILDDSGHQARKALEDF